MKLSTANFRLFAAIADHGGITAAARKLGLTKSLVSRELVALEDRLGTRLVQRTTRRVSLTDTGAMLASYARRVVEEMDNAEAAIEATRDYPRGDLKVSAPFSILRFVLVPRLAAFRARYPDVRLSLDASLRVIDLIEEGIDVAIRIGELPPSSLVARRLATTSIVLVAAPTYLRRHDIPQAPGDLIAHDIVNLKRDTGRETWVLEGVDAERASVAVTPSIAVHDPGLILDLTRQGLGVAPLPELYAAQALASGELVRVLPGWTRGVTPIHAVYPSRRILAPKLSAFVEFAAEAMRAAQ
jgi:molybdate transport repressor ModE-like protein